MMMLNLNLKNQKLLKFKILHQKDLILLIKQRNNKSKKLNFKLKILQIKMKRKNISKKEQIY